MNTKDPGAARDGLAQLLLVVLVCLAILSYSLFYSDNGVSDPFYLAGQSLVPALIIWGACRALFARWAPISLKFGDFVAIYAAFIAGGLVAASQQKQEAVRAVSSIQHEVSRLAAAVTDTSGLPRHVQRTRSLAPTASGEFGEVERFVKEFLDRSVAQRNDYLLEFEAIGWTSILHAQRIKDDTGLSESMVMIDQAKAIVARYEEKSVELVQQSRADIDALEFSEAFRKQFEVGFERGLSRSKEQAAQLWRLEKRVVQQFESIFLLLAASEAWVVEGDQILFYRDDELAQFNAYIQSIQDLTQQQQALQRDVLADRISHLDSLRQAL